jgi:hypothetical protein
VIGGAVSDDPVMEPARQPARDFICGDDTAVNEVGGRKIMAASAMTASAPRFRTSFSSPGDA